MRKRLIVPAAVRRAGLCGVALIGAVACGRSSAKPSVALTPASAPSASAPSAAACTVPAATASASLAGTPITDPLVTFDTAWAIIARTHWDTTYNGVNWRALRDTLRPKAAAAKTTGELRAVLSDMVGSLKQSHFSIIPREVSDATTGGSSSAASSSDPNGTIGATLRYIDGSVMVTQVPMSSAAAKASVRTGWILEAVNGCPLSTRLSRIPKNTDPRRAALTAYSAATQMLAGPAGAIKPFHGLLDSKPFRFAASSMVGIRGAADERTVRVMARGRTLPDWTCEAVLDGEPHSRCSGRPRCEAAGGAPAG